VSERQRRKKETEIDRKDTSAARWAASGRAFMSWLMRSNKERDRERQREKRETERETERDRQKAHLSSNVRARGLALADAQQHT
jgi:DNA-binding IclR family transcriptional regulator